jgi:hypothetical protein
VSERVFRRYLDTYLDAIRGLRYAQLDQYQPEPYASVAHGGGGTAYALWRLARTRSAASWIDASLRDRRRSAFVLEDSAASPRSYGYGRAGLYWVRALIGGPRRAAAVAAFTRYARDERREVEFLSGTAGHLTGARLLLAQFEHAGLRSLAEELAQRLLRRVRARSRKPWQPFDMLGFAHHWPGVLHAVLAWLRFAGESPPPWLADALEQLLAMWQPDVARVPALAASWCNGSSGTLLLWVEAYEATRDARYLAAARVAAERTAATASLAGADLCCGDGGAAYALLALARIDGAWRTPARELAARAIAAPAMKWPNGLYRGHPGLVCLALDISDDQPAGFPLIAA